MNDLVKRIFKNLENNNIMPIYAENSEKAREIVKDMLFEGAVIASGGSVSLIESGVIDIIKGKDYTYVDRSEKGISEEERLNRFKQVVGIDFYFCSTNALTEKGELVNIDGTSNRISAIAFGPKKVVMVVGKNKVVKDVSAGALRVKSVAAPKNCERLNIDNPCRRLGRCVSLLSTKIPDITDGCNCATRICRNYLVSTKQSIKDRIVLIYVDENLGY